jgi:hypothetical protein
VVREDAQPFSRSTHGVHGILNGWTGAIPGPAENLAAISDKNGPVDPSNRGDAGQSHGDTHLGGKDFEHVLHAGHDPGEPACRGLCSLGRDRGRPARRTSSQSGKSPIC